MLSGRAGELRTIAAVLANARSGRARSLLLHGGAGYGKTALLDAAAQQAQSSGMRVVRMVAAEVEAGIPAAGIGLLLPLLGAERGTDGVAGLLRALIAASGPQPLLVVIDDAQWLDGPSVRSVAFAARRLLADPVCLMIATRPDRDVVRVLADVQRLEVVALSTAEGRALLQTRHPEMPDATADQITTEFAGVPLPLVEVGALLDPAVIDGRAPLTSPIPVSSSVQERYAAGFTSLDGRTQLALVLLAADSVGNPAVLADASRACGVDEASWLAAEAVGLVRVSPSLSFVHPLARAAVHSAALPHQRRKAHAALGRTWREHGDEAKALPHLATAVVGTDAQLARSLAELAGRRATTTEGRSEAGSLALIAAALTDVESDRELMLLLAAECSVGAQATHLARQVAAQASGADVVARATFVRVDQDPELDSAARVRLVADLEALTLSADVLQDTEIWSVWTAMDAADIDRLRGIAARHEGGADEPSSWRLLGVLGLAFTFLGLHDRAVPLLVRALDESERVDPRALAPDRLLDWAVIPGWLGDDIRHHDRFQRMDVLLRATGSPANAATAAFFMSERARREGSWVRAEALLRESIDLSPAVGVPDGTALVRLASLYAPTGDADRVEACIREAQQHMDKAGSRWPRGWIHEARGALALATNRPYDAIAELSEFRDARFLGRGARDAVAMGLADLVEAHVLAGDPGAAREVADGLAQRLRGVVDPFGIAVVARVQALTRPEDADELFVLALTRLADTSEVFQVSRTELMYGAHLRRTRRPRLAREPLARAVHGFEQVGALPWARRGRAELAAAGQRPPTPAAPTADRPELTSQELRVALAAVDGMTNSEIATALFLSVKTIEFHLGNIYRKLELRSRGGLAKALQGL